MIMRKLILTDIALFASVIILTQAGNRFPINPLAMWKIVKIQYSIDGSGEKVLEKYEYYIKNDTLLNAMNYYKLYKFGIAYYDTPFYYKNVYAGAIRGDDNKIFYIRKDQTSEVLLIDYNLKLEDTIRSEIGKSRIINKIDTLSDGRLCFSSIPSICGGCCSSLTLIEGIGHSGGIVEPPPCYHVGANSNLLACYKENTNLVYPSDRPPLYCDEDTYIPPSLKNTFKLSVYPIPANRILTVDFHHLLQRPSILNIYDIIGSLALSEKIYSKNNKTEIDIQNLKRGVYLIKINSDDFCFTKKIVIE